MAAAHCISLLLRSQTKIVSFAAAGAAADDDGEMVIVMMTMVMMMMMMMMRRRRRTMTMTMTMMVMVMVMVMVRVRLRVKVRARARARVRRKMTMTLVGTLAPLKYSHIDWPLRVCDPVSPCQWRLCKVSSCHQVSVNQSTQSNYLSHSVQMTLSSFQH